MNHTNAKRVRTSLPIKTSSNSTAYDTPNENTMTDANQIIDSKKIENLNLAFNNLVLVFYYINL